MAKSWKLSVHNYEAIADHHKTQPIFSGEIPCQHTKMNLLAILKLAEMVCKTYETFGCESTDYEFDRIKDDLFAYLGISEYEFEELAKEVLGKRLEH